MKNSPFFNDWLLDRLSGNQYPKLHTLDLRGTKVTHNGLTALYRIPSLRKLYVDHDDSIQFKLACAMLEEININLKILTQEDHSHDTTEYNI